MNKSVQSMLQYFQQIKKLHLQNCKTNEKEWVSTESFIELRGGPEEEIFIVICRDGNEFYIDIAKFTLYLLDLAGFVRTSEEGSRVNPKHIKSLNHNRMTITFVNGEEVLVEVPYWKDVVAAYNECRK